jgi:hypothetical protein
MKQKKFYEKFHMFRNLKEKILPILRNAISHRHMKSYPMKWPLKTDNKRVVKTKSIETNKEYKKEKNKK